MNKLIVIFSSKVFKAAKYGCSVVFQQGRYQGPLLVSLSGTSLDGWP